ncbi:sirohydrochlorin chelatase [Aeoliella mucimassa]|uniref:Sirohydrochlorin cobaltochelatase n=1 Tax=Aeoliella mucimassa TaxID=2527972 RepID=A0A518AGS0_9BACT|nr:CbiX/SirB N-terminal domain-containing protein [Aeoliella mucimassa]QDU53920.1 sirohydrochlorin cobaltochelatase [Aeoliella mucimassa]
MNRYRRPRLSLLSTLGLIALFLAAGCQQTTPSESSLPVADPHPAGPAKTGILLVSHGSHSEQWRTMLTQLGDEVQTELVATEGIDGVKSAFMEYTEPSIATRLKEFDAEGYTRVILIPILLTVSSHSFDDIPTIVGLKEDAKSLLTLESEGIERYTPQATVTLAPLLDFSQLLEKNLPRRFAELSKSPAEEGVVLVAYGSEPFNEEWEAFFAHTDEVVQQTTGAAEVVHTWCGHIAHYSGDPTKQAIDDLLTRRERVIVIPVLVARDEGFQGRIIGGAVAESSAPERVAYAGDAILPDKNLNEWIVTIARKLQSESTESPASE